MFLPLNEWNAFFLLQDLGVEVGGASCLKPFIYVDLTRLCLGSSGYVDSVLKTGEVVYFRHLYQLILEGECLECFLVRQLLLQLQEEQVATQGTSTSVQVRDFQRFLEKIFAGSTVSWHVANTLLEPFRLDFLKLFFCLLESRNDFLTIL